METKNDRKQRMGVSFKRTPQRLAILAYLEGNTSHPSAEDIYRAVSKKYHSMSFATVYNTLNMLAKAGTIRELTIDPVRKRFDPDVSQHHHLMCVLCGRIVDISGGLTVDLPDNLAQDFDVLGSHVEFYGHCGSCKKKRKLS